MVSGPVFEDNTEGVERRPLHRSRGWCRACSSATAGSTTADDPSLIDIAPTALQLFGLEPPPHMDGRPLGGASR